MNKKRFNPFARRRSRQLALQGLYAQSMSNEPIVEIMNLLSQQPDAHKADQLYLNALLQGVAEYREHFDCLLQPHLDRPFAELDLIELSILRIAVFELLYREEIPAKVIINEAIELAKGFGATESHKFVNGVLDKIAKQTRDQLHKGS